MPRADQPWHEVLALIGLAGRFDARERLTVAEGTAFGQQPMTEASSGERVQLHAKLERLAYGGEP